MPTLKQLRENVLLSRAELAHLIDVHPQTIYEWEHAKARPSPANRRKLIGALGVSAQVLLQAIEETRKETQNDRAAA